MKIINRTLYSNKIEPFINKGVIKVLTGQRRVGKSYIMLQLVNKITKENRNANVIYINKEDDQYRAIRNDVDLSALIETKLNKKKQNYLFIDEIQDIEHFENTLRSLQAKEYCDIFCTGSNAKMLSSELSTYLSGRYVEIRIHSLCYVEFMEFHKLQNNDDTLKKYLTYGGMPHLAKLELNDEVAFEYLKNVYSTILLKDVVSRENIRNVDFLETLTDYMADNVGNLFSANNIHKFLKSQKVEMSVNLIVNYLKALQNAYIINKVQRIDIKGLKKFEVNDKYYFEDLGLRNCKQHLEFSTDINKLMENAVYLHLRINNYQVFIGKLDNLEIDFVGLKNDTKVYVQVTYLLPDEKTRQREFGNLLKINNNYPKYVVSMDGFGAGKNYKGIRHIHIRDFLKMAEF
ncbi:MAG: ATP-binding protein [Bacteroidales bacterium]|jgi:predicted AAA+ superfamily ATPase|nr:ATP-binding protein [Bacteroidales bacterium]